MKVTVIGGASTYSPELVKGFLDIADSFPLKELCLMDIDGPRLDIVGGFAKRMVAAQGNPFEIKLQTNQREAIRNASYVLTQLRVGGMEARKGDEYLGKRHGLIGQETTGVGGMAKALRTIPVVLDIAKDILETAPEALLFNFTNPAGLITEALRKYTPEIQSFGVCNVPITAKMDIIAGLENISDQKIDSNNVFLDTLGLNHLSWHRGFTLNGEDVWPDVFNGFLSELKESDDPDWDLDTVEALKMIPNYYLEYYYYTEKKLSAQNNWPPSRAEEVVEIEKDLINQFANPNKSELPEDVMKRGGAYYSTLATQLLNAHFNNLDEVQTVNVPHKRAVPDWPADWVLEIPCRINRNGLTPIPTKPLPLVCYGLIAQVKAYELLTVEAAVHGDRNSAYQALLTHPLGPAANKISSVLDDLLETNKEFLGWVHS
ncbi:MAG: hypothetical protein JEZ06_10815 [Anaerolineaceae bacterium]|nr:hypothetical protein [Anaerolineaceae bacterium]